MRASVGIKLGFWLALLGTASTGLTGYYVYDRSRQLLVGAAQAQLLSTVQGLSHRFGDALTTTAKDAKTLANLSLCRQIALAKPGSEPAAAKAQLADLFSALLKSHPEYSQVRLIHAQRYGKELVRVDRDRDSVQIVADAQLQEKNHFPYVFETLSLPATEEIYVSEINLNQELGAHQGFGKPTVRVAVPIGSAPDGYIALVVVNVDLDGLFTLIAGKLPAGIRLLLSNGSGDYLIHPDQAKTFGFERGRRFVIQDDIPEVGEVLYGKRTSAVFATGTEQTLAASSLAAFAKLPLGPQNRRFALLGVYTPLAEVLAGSHTLGWKVVEITAIFSLLASAISLVLARILAKPLNQMTQAVSRFQLGQPLDAAPTGRRDEIGYLANSFVSMTQQLNAQVAELYASEAKLHAILDNAPVGIWLIGMDRRFAFANKTFCSHLGLPEKQVVAYPNLAELLGEELAARFSVADQACLNGADPVHQALERVKFADGKRRVLQITRTRLQDINGKPVGVIGIAMDISDRQHAADRERAHNHVLELVAKGAPLAGTLDAVVLAVETQNPDLLCSILLLDEQGKRLHIAAAPHLPGLADRALDGLPVEIGAGNDASAAYCAERTIVEDIQQHPYWAPFKELAAQAGLGACWSEPIRDASGKLLGCLAIYQHKPAAPNADDLLAIEQAANLAGIAVERSRSTEALQLASLVYQNSSEAMAVMDADCAIITVNPAFTELTGYTLAEVAGQSHAILNSNRQSEQFYQAMLHTIGSSGHWKGELWNRRKNGEIFAELLTINTIFNADGSPHRRVAMFSDITQKKQSEELIWTQANFDPLTGLPNRRMFHDRLDQETKKCQRSGLPLALIFIDLDRFKEINDTLGHDMGDMLLKDAALRLSRCVRESDTVARLGGDEFTMILPELDDIASAERVAQSILRTLAEPFQLKNKVAYLSASVGITLYPQDAEKIDALIKNADQAMYAAKHQGRNRYCYFTPAMHAAAHKRMLIAGDLRSALANGQFRLYYQPIVELASGKIMKAEALLRWHHPERGPINPAEFIPIAEDNGLIVDIGNWVFEQAARQARRWREHYHPEFQISINKSPAQFYGSQSHDAWLDYLRELGLAGQGLVVEITEGLLLDASNVVRNSLQAFRDAGMQISLDDFGTGYSALAYLKKFDIDYLKIDRSFVANLAPDSSDMALCEAIIVMAHKLGMQVIAEGLETENQHRLLLESGCDFGQGYHFSRPLPAEDFERFLSAAERPN
ncbi:bifunctional diguanylate cyclase/phosphodiesterase [Methylomonas koyamae]|uniref:bifunctional diguanylate cyclase/phosphodiesterase n=1 Tax=Methylomonas koyamae TaxID=702114 RepID=UPI0028739956|nr:EAL domain-containing protein [Methylomonas koyamae]WNB76715.1 EAL domain-containing protein [Methylomonas koyamae]